MTYNMLMGMLNPTHSLTHSLYCYCGLLASCARRLLMQRPVSSV